ncbi:adenosine kinase [Alphaproteobacteria bacterium]|nr:adenosine kinase [Alphaproteobacteria bacterium]
MSSSSLITGMGAALVDLFADVSDAELATLGSAKASMSLIDAAQSSAMQSGLKLHTKRPGGSSANTVAGIAALGQGAGFLGKIGDDDLGQLFTHAFEQLDVAFSVSPCDASQYPTGHCLVLVTPDAERTMHTVLGASVTTSPEDMDADLLGKTGLLFSEGYVWDSPSAREGFLHAAQIVRGQGGKVAFSLADAFCVQRHHADFLALLDTHIDIVLANKAEAQALFGSDAPDGWAESLAGREILMAVTMGAQGSLIIDGATTTHVATQPVSDIVDLTGAGDQFAAGFLAALHNGVDPQTAASIGNLAAGEVIRHFGPRPQSDVRALLAENGLDFS